MTETILDATGSPPRSRTTVAHGPPRARTRCLHGGHALLVAASVASCSYPPLQNTPVDGAPADGPAVDAAGPPPSSPLLLSEIVLTTVPGSITDPGEMIEIVNTSADDVPLSTYYLTDSGNYYQLPVGTTVDPTDFIVKFPDPAVIQGHQVITIAIATPTDFASTYGVAPSYSLRDGSLQTIAMNGAPQLANAGEPIILFQWDGHSDLVRDVDIMIVGAPTGATNALPNKSNVTQDSLSDMDMMASKYAVDLGTIHAQPTAPGNGVSTKRIALEDTHETHGGGGNGPSGDDETSEDTSVTWDGTTASPFSAATPGTVPAALMR